MKPVLLDTGVIVALLDRSERHHGRCAEVVNSLGAPLVTCEAVIAEACYLLRRLEGAAEAVVENAATRAFEIPFHMSEEAESVRRILRKYRDRRIDLADACLIQLANEYRTGAILTLDKHFEIYRWGKNLPFELLVPLK